MITHEEVVNILKIFAIAFLISLSLLILAWTGILSRDMIDKLNELGKWVS